MQKWSLALYLLHTGAMFGVETPRRDKVGRHVWLSSWHCLLSVLLPQWCESRAPGSHSGSAKLPVLKTLQESEVTLLKSGEKNK